MKKFIPIILTAVLISLASCGGGMYASAPEGDDGANGGETPDTNTPYKTPWGNVKIVKDAFIFGSDYPSDIVIPDIDGMRDTAFVVSYANPSGVIAIDLTKNPLSISRKFAGLISPSGSGMPNRLYITASNKAYLLTSTHIVEFNPTTGVAERTVVLKKKIRFQTPHAISAPFDTNGDGRKESSVTELTVDYPAGISFSGNKLFVTMSDYISPISPAIAGPGVVKIFDITNGLTEQNTVIFTTDFNPTGITRLPDGKIAVTNSGVSDIWDGAAHPLTTSSIDIIDPATSKIVANIPLGISALSAREISVTEDGKRAYLASMSFGELYSIDLENMKAVHTHADPITLTGNLEGSDYISSLAKSYDDWYIFAASFDNSSIYPVDISDAEETVLPDVFSEPFVLGFPKGVSRENPTGTNTGIGVIAVRPGTPGTDFYGPDIYALTGNPGTLVTIDTRGSGAPNSVAISKMAISPETIEPEETGTSVQFHLDIEFADGKKVEGVTDQFTSPFSGYPTLVKWSSSMPNIGTIDQSGKLKVRGTGLTSISASVGQSSAITNIDISIREDATASDEPEIVEPPASDEPVDEPTDEPTTDDTGTDDGTPPATDDNIAHTYFSSDLWKIILPFLMGIYDFTQPDDTPEDHTPEIDILTTAPAGTDAFVDSVVSFEPGTDAGYGSGNMPDVVMGPPHGNTTGMGSLDVVSLGVGGEITLEMTDFIIADGIGPDFTVFENPLFTVGNPLSAFAEPGIVSVSEDGEHFVEFACDRTDTVTTDGDGKYPGCAGTYPTYSNTENEIDPTDPAISGGNQFDLADVGLETARFVRIRDIATTTMGGTSAGFDLDSIAVINGTVP